MTWKAKPVTFDKVEKQNTEPKTAENAVDKTVETEEKTTVLETTKKVSKAAASRSQAMGQKRAKETKRKKVISNRELMRMDKERAEKEYMRDLYRDGTNGVITGKIDVTLFNHVIDVIVKDLGFHPDDITNRTAMEFCAGVACGSAELVEDPYAKIYVERYLAKQNDLYKDKYQSVMDSLSSILENQNKANDGIGNLIYAIGLVMYQQSYWATGNTIQEKMQHTRMTPTDPQDIDYLINETRRLGERSVAEWKQRRGRSIHGMLDKFADK